jgi:hypothetical protein
MKAKFGAIVVAGSGKIGGHVASRNRAGAYFRTKVTPINPQSSAQLGARNRLSGISQGWRDLTAAQRAAWAGAVSQFSKTDVFGDIKNPSGFNLYQRLNNNIITVGGTPIVVPPSPTEAASVVIGALVADVNGDVLTLALSAAVPAGSEVKVFATPNLSPGISFVKSEYRLIEVVDNGTASPLDIEASYTAKFGALIVGQKLFVKIVFTDPLTGLESLPQEASTVVIDSV